MIEIGVDMLETIALKRKAVTRKGYDQVVAACCQECTVGCGLLAYVKDERIVDIQGDEDHPVLFQRVLEAQKAGAMIIAVDSRFTATLSKANMAVQIIPNRGNDLGLALMKIFLETQSVDLSINKSKSKDFQQWSKTFTTLDIGHLAGAIGIQKEGRDPSS